MSNIIDIESLIKPISQSNPCGEDISYDEDFILLKDRRKIVEERSLDGWEEKKIVDPKTLSKIERPTIDICSSLLINKSKNLNVCAYLIDDMIKKSGCSGFLAGLELLQSLCEKYWQGLYPIIEGKSFEEERTKTFFWMDEMYSLSISTAKLGIASKGDLSFDEIEKYNNLGAYSKINLEDSKEQIDYDLFLQKINPEIVNEKIIFVIDQIFEKIEAFTFYLNQIMSTETIFFPKIFSRLSEIKYFFIDFTKVVEEETDENDDDGNNEASSRQNFGQRNSDSIGKNSRDQLYEKIESFAASLKKCEPHSPVPDFILKVVSWKNLSFIEIISELGADSPFFNLLKQHGSDRAGRPSRRSYGGRDDDDDDDN